ncbi:hypothetical protein HDU85_001776 [Gaertneriomyces sp. JEL0708]|nr:hypothetical protein HDU85_001776 [Gaertneriomyces sp. JEL0708]
MQWKDYVDLQLESSPFLLALHIPTAYGYNNPLHRHLSYLISEALSAPNEKSFLEVYQFLRRTFEKSGHLLPTFTLNWNFQTFLNTPPPIGNSQQVTSALEALAIESALDPVSKIILAGAFLAWCEATLAGELTKGDVAVALAYQVKEFLNTPGHHISPSDQALTLASLRSLSKRGYLPLAILEEFSPTIFAGALSAPTDTMATNPTPLTPSDVTPGVTAASLLQELGYAASSSQAALKRVLDHAGITSDNASSTLREEDVARILVMMVKTHSGLEQNVATQSAAAAIFRGLDSSVVRQMASWDVELVISTLLEMNNKLDWTSVLRNCDTKDFVIFDERGLTVFLTAAKVALKDLYHFPIGVFFGRWNNERGQFSFLRQVIYSVPDLIGANLTIRRRPVADAVPVNRVLFVGSSSSAFNSLDLIETLMAISDGPLYEDVKSLFEYAVQQSPELLVLAFAQVAIPWNKLMTELVPSLVVSFLTGHPNAGFILPRLWQANSGLCVTGLLHLYAKDPSSLSRILDVAQEMKALPQILETKPFPFAIDLAALASRRDYLNLEKWLQDHIRDEGMPFITACLEFLEEKISSRGVRHEVTKRSVPLSPDAVGIFLRVLHSHMSSLNAANQEYLNAISKHAVQAYPSAGASPASGDTTPPEGTTAIPEDVEEEATSYIGKMFKGEHTVAQIVELLQRFKSSSTQREQVLYKCMVHNLFEEYKFFERYPEKELMLTGVLFGSLIQNQVVTGNALGVALRYVLDALRQPVGSALFKFGIQALNQFQQRLAEWPNLSGLVLQISHLADAHPDIIEYIKSIQSANPGVNTGELSNVDANLSLSSTDPAAFREATRGSEGSVTSIRPDTLLEATGDMVEVPGEVTKDKILFIINNVSVANLEVKVAEMRDILQDQYFRWFSQYIVVKRASIEQNFHSLYISFLDALESKSLNKHILNETYANIRVLLASEKTVTSSQERALLKNLGIWLGGLTLAKDKPIKHKSLAVKELLVQGYDSGRLIVVIPFVCKMLSECSRSKVFKPPNPWLMAIMKVLAELYEFADLKLNLKFEIEVLCKAIDLDLKEVEPSSLLRARSPSSGEGTKRAPSAGPEMVPKGVAQALPLSKLEPASGYDTPDTGALAPASIQGIVVDEASAGLLDITGSVTYNPNLPMFASHPALKRIVHIAIDRAIREILAPVVERAVTIAGIATKELVIKDFALEPDENRMRKAAHLMVSSLAGSLAAVSSREPLRSAMGAHLRNLLIQNGFTEQTVPEQAVYIVVADNLDLACNVLERAAAQRSVPDIDNQLQPAYENRRKHRARTNQAFYDMAVYTASRYPSTLPDPLRLKIGGLNAQQLRVYDDFLRLPRPAPGAQIVDAEKAQRSQLAARPGSATSGTFDDPGLQAAKNPLDKFGQLISSLDKITSQEPTMTLKSLPPQHELRTLMTEFSMLFSHSANREDVLLLYGQKLMLSMYTNDNAFAREICVFLLTQLCQTSKRLTKDIEEWLLYHDDERKYNVNVTILLLQANLLSLPELDMQLARLLDGGQSSVAEFAIRLMEQCLSAEPPLAGPIEFMDTVEMMSNLALLGGLSPSIVHRLDSVRSQLPIYNIREISSREGETDKLKETLAAVFSDWVKSFFHPASSEKSHLRFIQQLQQQVTPKTESVAPLFYRVCTELSVEAYEKASATPGAQPFRAVDAWARLIIMLVRYHVDPTGADNNHARLNLTAKILSIVVLVLVHAHEAKGAQFNQRPFFRLFSTLLNDLNTFQRDLQPIHMGILSAVSNTFHTLQPSFLPGFTFSWLQLISHRYFMPKLLLAENQKFWPFFQRLLVDLFKFLAPFLGQNEMADTTRLLYKATIRILLVLLHDFPEFLCDYHFSFVDVIPLNCVQMRNIILSAFPRNMRLPDPFTPNLKVDLLPEINQPPHILSDYTSNLLPNNFKLDIDAYLKTRAPVSFLTELRNRLLLPAGTASEVHYNIPAMNALVLYVGVQAIAQNQVKASQALAPITHSAPLDIFQQLANDLDHEGRYLFLSAIVNQLRYPNSHTHYFSCVLLYLFAEATQELIQEQITRVLVERLIVSKPHPYGLLITFIELIRNPRFNFWEHTNFIRCSPEIERLFSSVAKSMNQTVPV